MRTGSEPTQARSPLRLRLGLSVWGLVWAVAGSVGFRLAGYPAPAILFAALGVVSLVDMGIVIRHLRQGPHYQPGRDIPPYWPVDSQPYERPRRR